MDKVRRKPKKQRVGAIPGYCVQMHKRVRVQDMDHRQWAAMSTDQQITWLYWGICELLNVDSCFLNWGNHSSFKWMMWAPQALFCEIAFLVFNRQPCLLYQTLLRLEFTKHDYLVFEVMLDKAHKRHVFYTTGYKRTGTGRRPVYRPWYRLTYEYIIKTIGITEGG